MTWTANDSVHKGSYAPQGRKNGGLENAKAALLQIA